MTTRAPSPCSADSSSEASAKEEATQGKPTDDARLTEIERKFNTGDVLSRTEAQAVFAALRAAQAERDEAHGYMSRLFLHLAPQCKALPDCLGVATQLDNYIAGLHAERDAQDALHVDLGVLIREADERAEAAERERNAQAAEVRRCNHIIAEQHSRLTSAERERDALREALGKYGIHTASCEWPWRFDHDPSKCTCGLFAALAPRPPCSAEATQGKPVKEE